MLTSTINSVFQESQQKIDFFQEGREKNVYCERRKEKAGQKLLGQPRRMCSVHLRKHSSYLKTMDYESTLLVI